MVTDLLDVSRQILADSGARSAQEIRELGYPVIAFSDRMAQDITEFRKFLFTRVYRAPTVMDQRRRVTQAVDDLFPIFMDDPTLLPRRWHKDVQAAQDETTRARLVADYIAGMTDRFALQQHAKLTGTDILDGHWETGLSRQ